MTAPDPGGFAANARREAHQILSGSQYQRRPQRTFDPLGGVIRTVGRWLGDVFYPPAHWIWHHFLSPVSGDFANAFGSFWPVVAGLLLMIIGILIGRYAISKRQRIDTGPPGANPIFMSEDPQQLDLLAEGAEGRRDWHEAIRLRFRAGILRLDRTGAIDRGTTKTTRQISAALGSPTFDALSVDLEAIVYAGAPATAEQADRAREGWPIVVSEARDANTRAA
jgi:hypothetical protein